MKHGVAIAAVGMMALFFPSSLLAQNDGPALQLNGPNPKGRDISSKNKWFTTQLVGVATPPKLAPYSQNSLKRPPVWNAPQIAAVQFRLSDEDDWINAPKGTFGLSLSIPSKSTDNANDYGRIAVAFLAKKPGQWRIAVWQTVKYDDPQGKNTFTAQAACDTIIYWEDSQDGDLPTDLHIGMIDLKNSTKEDDLKFVRLDADNTKVLVGERMILNFDGTLPQGKAWTDYLFECNWSAEGEVFRSYTVLDDGSSAHVHNDVQWKTKSNPEKKEGAPSIRFCWQGNQSGQKKVKLELKITPTGKKTVTKFLEKTFHVFRPTVKLTRTVGKMGAVDAGNGIVFGFFRQIENKSYDGFAVTGTLEMPEGFPANAKDQYAFIQKTRPERKGIDDNGKTILQYIEVDKMGGGKEKVFLNGNWFLDNQAPYRGHFLSIQANGVLFNPAVRDAIDKKELPEFMADWILSDGPANHLPNDIKEFTFGDAAQNRVEDYETYFMFRSGRNWNAGLIYTGIEFVSLRVIDQWGFRAKVQRQGNDWTTMQGIMSGEFITDGKLMNPARQPTWDMLLTNANIKTEAK